MNVSKNLFKKLSPWIHGVILFLSVVVIYQIATPTYKVTQDVKIVKGVKVKNPYVQKLLNKKLEKKDSLIQCFRNLNLNDFKDYEEYDLEYKYYHSIITTVGLHIHSLEQQLYNKKEDYALVTTLQKKRNGLYETVDKSVIHYKQIVNGKVDPCTIKHEFQKKILVMQKQAEDKALREKEKEDQIKAIKTCI